jgi:thiol-disulfide isomerase/thioredoxin
MDSREHLDNSDYASKVKIGEEVPDFQVTIDGRKWKLSELRKNTETTTDGTFVLTFWCSFCHSCRHVEHQLDGLAKKYKGQVAVIALDASAGETTENVAEFAQQHGLSLPIALDANGIAADIFGVRVTTTTVVIDRRGVLRYRGQFRDGKHTFAEDALQAVLAGNDVLAPETRQQG